MKIHIKNIGLNTHFLLTSHKRKIAIFSLYAISNGPIFKTVLAIPMVTFLVNRPIDLLFWNLYLIANLSRKHLIKTFEQHLFKAFELHSWALKLLNINHIITKGVINSFLSVFIPKFVNHSLCTLSLAT